jgi:signal transduction histidine kinase
VTEPDLTEPLWRALAVYRIASLAYAVGLVIYDHRDYSRLGWAWAALAVMALWTVTATVGYARPGRREAPLLTADLVLTALLLLSTVALQKSSAVHGSAMPVTGTWIACPVLAWAVRFGRRAGLLSALAMSACYVLLRGHAVSAALNGSVLLVLAGVIVGHLSRLAAEVEKERRHVIAVEAASQERERLARDIHDSVLQVLALVQRRGAEAGGEAAELGRLAGQQEAALRGLIGTRPAISGLAEPAGTVDLAALLVTEGSEHVTVSVPALPVLIKETAAGELVSAVRAALANVRRHCGERARAWVLVEDEPDAVTVTVRDDGPGIPAGRLAEAAAAGRLGISHSIQGRVRDLGGSAEIRSVPGDGTEVELRVPR